MTTTKGKVLCDISAVGVASIIFDGPYHNALDGHMIEALLERLEDVQSNPDVRVVVIRSVGATFCAGLNLRWLQETTPNKALLEKSLKQLDQCFRLIKNMPQPVVILLNGPVYGMAVGLLATADFVLATEESYVCCPEVRLGQLPALTLPLIRDILGVALARQLFFTGQRLSSEAAAAYGLISTVVPEVELDGAAESLINALLDAGPQALTHTKAILNGAQTTQPYDLVTWLNAAESQEGMKAFLDKREPTWVQHHEG